MCLKTHIYMFSLNRAVKLSPFPKTCAEISTGAKGDFREREEGTQGSAWRERGRVESSGKHSSVHLGIVPAAEQNVGIGQEF